MEASTIKFMFLGATGFEGNKVVRGTILLTDEKTVPLEFRCTDPIRPSDLQRTLYGKILDEHVLIELIGIPLFGASNTAPEIAAIDFDGVTDAADWRESHNGTWFNSGSTSGFVAAAFLQEGM